MSKELALKIEHVSKQYRLGQIGGGTLRGDLQSWWAKIRGKEDPNTKIGTKQFEKNERFWALDDIDIEIKKGEAVGIIGHNGAGKSTLLKLLSRVTAPTTGKIYMNGRIASMLEVGTGFHPEMTGRENIYMNGAILGMTKEEIDSKVDEIIDFSECRQFIDTPVKRYSSGMYVKLAFAVAAHLDSEILVMDEVLAVGDMKFQQKALGRMGDAAGQEGRTVLYVSHNMNTIRQLCTRCIVLEHGHVVFDGDVEKAITIYMDRDRSFPTKYDYTNTKRMDMFDSNMQTVYLQSLEFTGREEAVIVDYEPLKFRLHCTGKKTEDKMFIRIEVSSLSNKTVGTSFLSKGMSMEEINSTLFSWDISSLVNGDYITVMSIFLENEFGTRQELDAINPAFQFSVQRETEMVWSTQWWGNVKLPDIVEVPEHE